MEDNISDDVTIGHTEDVRSTCNSDRPSRRSYKQIYRKDWENNPIFKGKCILQANCSGSDIIV